MDNSFEIIFLIILLFIIGWLSFVKLMSLMHNAPRNHQFLMGVMLTTILGAIATLPGLFFYHAAAIEFGPYVTFSEFLMEEIFIPIIGAGIGAFFGIIGGLIGLAKSSDLEIDQSSENLITLETTLMVGAIGILLIFCSSCGLGMFAAI